MVGTAIDNAHAWVWLDGRWVPSSEATLGVFSHGLHYGTTVFDGCRFHRAAGGGRVVFRLSDHVRRLFASARAMFMELAYREQEVLDACVELVGRAQTDEGYLRMMAWYGDDAIGIGASNRAVVALMSWRAPAPAAAPLRLRIAGLGHGEGLLPGAKLAGHYARSFLARRQAQRTGCDDALFVGPDGTIAEATGASVFMVRDGELRTPPREAPILPSVTRDTVLTLAAQLEIPTVEGRIRRDALFGATELLLVNSSRGITPVGSIEGYVLDAPGSITRRLVTAYAQVVTGAAPDRHGWLTRVP